MGTKTILKWAGNKSKVMSQITPFFPKEYNNYFEPFAGALGAFLHSDVTGNAYLNDLNSELINLFECVRDDYLKVCNLANSIEKSKENYYEVRNLDRNPSWIETNRFEKAARTVFLNKTCFNGLYRVNKSGFSNVPYGTPRKGLVLPEAEAEAFSRAISNVTFSNLDYNVFLQNVNAGDLVYMDPPYIDIKNPYAKFNGYVGQFGWEQQEQLISTAKNLAEKGAFVVISNSFCDASLELYKDFNIQTITAPRYISCKKNGRKPVLEIVATTY